MHTQKPFVLFAFQFYPSVFFPFPIFSYREENYVQENVNCNISVCLFLLLKGKKTKAQKRDWAGVFLYKIQWEETLQERFCCIVSLALASLTSWLGWKKTLVNIYLAIRVPSSASRSRGPAVSITCPLPSQGLAWTRLCQPQWWLVHVGLHLIFTQELFPHILRYFITSITLFVNIFPSTPKTLCLMLFRLQSFQMETTQKQWHLSAYISHLYQYLWDTGAYLLTCFFLPSFALPSSFLAFTNYQNACDQLTNSLDSISIFFLTWEEFLGSPQTCISLSLFLKCKSNWLIH